MHGTFPSTGNRPANCTELSRVFGGKIIFGFVGKRCFGIRTAKCDVYDKICGRKTITNKEKAQLYAQVQLEVSQDIDDAVQVAVADAMRQQQASIARQQQQTANTFPASTFGAASLPSAPVKWQNDNLTQKYLDKDFAAATNFYRGQAEQARWSMSSGAFQGVLQRSNNVVRAINPENLNLFNADRIITTETTHIIPSGTYLNAIKKQEICQIWTA